MGKALRSQAFVNAYLRIDGSGISAPNARGAGTVNCQSGVADFEVLEEEAQADGTVALASVAFPNVYVRMDGSGVTSPTADGAGVVNCAFGTGPWEKFHRRVQPDGSVAYESAAFPGVYLRMDGRTVDAFGVAAGSGIVNCQFGVGAWEKFVEQRPPFTSITWRSAEGAQTTSGATGAAGIGGAGQALTPEVRENPLTQDPGDEGYNILHRP
jgi:hypothetical protein